MKGFSWQAALEKVRRLLLTGDWSTKLWEYVVRRLFMLVFVVIGVTMITFVLSQVLLDPVVLYLTEKTPDDAIAVIVAHYHLNDPWPVRYGVFLWNLILGDWGYSRTSSQPVLQALAERFPATAELAIATVIWTLIAGIPFGIVSALRNNELPDHVSRLVALTGVSTPVFWLGLLLQLVFFYYFHLLGWPNLPSSGRYDTNLMINHPNMQVTGFMILDSVVTGNFTMTQDLLTHLILPSFTLGFTFIGVIMRIMRSSMLEVLRQDYVVLARSKGLSERIVLYRHALKNAMIPTLTVAGLAFAGLLGGAPLAEMVFQWPGIGTLAVRGMGRNDSGLILGFTLMISLILVLVNLAVDILYVYLDPRIRY